MINIRTAAFRLTQSRVSYSSSAPVQVLNFRESVVGKDRVSFSFDIVLAEMLTFSGARREKVSSGFDSACPRDPRARRKLKTKLE